MERHGLREVHQELSRRDLLRLAGVGLSGLGLAAIAGCGDGDNRRSATSTPGAAVDPPPETTTIRLPTFGDICGAPQALAEEFLLAEGFTDGQPVDFDNGLAAVASGEADMTLAFAAVHAIRIDAGDPLTVLAGAQVGCWELFGTERVQSIGDLRGKTIAVRKVVAPTAPDYAIMATILTHIGIDPVKDVNFEAHPKKEEAIQLLAEGKVDAYLAFPPVSNDLRAKKIGHVIVNSMMDPPYSRYFCCLLAVNSGFFAKHPVATKRALRAILKAADLCAREPERAARLLVDKGYTDNYDYALATMKTIPYNVWREFDPEDTLRYYSLNLHEAGIIKKTPDEIIRLGTDWRLLNELKRELKET